MMYLALLPIVALVSAQPQQPKLQPEIEDAQQVLEDESIDIRDFDQSEWHKIYGLHPKVR